MTPGQKGATCNDPYRRTPDQPQQAQRAFPYDGPVLLSCQEPVEFGELPAEAVLPYPSEAGTGGDPGQLGKGHDLQGQLRGPAV